MMFIKLGNVTINYFHIVYILKIPAGNRLNTAQPEETHYLVYFNAEDGHAFKSMILTEEQGDRLLGLIPLSDPLQNPNTTGEN